MIALEDACHGAARLGVFVGHLPSCPMVEVGASRQAQRLKQLWQGICLLQGINQQGLVPIAQGLQVDARVFF